MAQDKQDKFAFAPPFNKQMAAVAARGPRFFVPGHKGNAAALPFLGPAAPGAAYWDLTEVDGACDLSCPSGPLAESEALMAKVYQSGATLYTTFGSSSAIGAMLTLFVGLGGKVVVARPCHVSAVRTLAFLGARPVWVMAGCGQGAPAGPNAAKTFAGEVDAALAQSGAKAVYVTSPDYYGNMADIAALAGVCARHDARLLVDNAHGAYLKFCRRVADGGKAPVASAAPGAAAVPPTLHPLDLGADATADSAHKTLPCLTGAALLHLHPRHAGLGAEARKALNLYSGTSPSYPILMSLDSAAGLLATAPPDFMAAAARFARALQTGFAEVYRPGAEPLKALLAPGKAGITPDVFHDKLLQKGIAPEYYDGALLVLMASPWNTEEDFARLEQALAELRAELLPGGPEAAFAAEAPALAPPAPQTLPRRALPLRDVLLCPNRETIPTNAAPGRVMAGLATPCPPGLPIVMPGEEITPEAAAQYAAGGILQLDVVK